MSNDRIELVLERMQTVQPSLSWEGFHTPHSQLHNVHERLPGLCADPIHLHSFAKEFSLSSLIRIRKCVGCQSRFATSSSSSGSYPSSTHSMRNFLEYASGRDNDLLRCVACGIYAHRSCVFNKQRRILDTCKVHEMAFEKRKKLLQQNININTQRTDRITNDESSTSIDTRSEIKNSTSTLILEDSSTVCNVNCSIHKEKEEEECTSTEESVLTETKDEDTTSSIWTPSGPPAHFAQIKPAILWGIKSKHRVIPDAETEVVNGGSGDQSLGMNGGKVTEEPPLGQSFINASKVLQETMFRYFSQPPTEVDKTDTPVIDITVSNEQLNALLEVEEQQQQQQASDDQIISSNKPTALAVDREPEIPLNLLVSPQPTRKNMDKSINFLENTLKGVRIDALAKRGVQWASAAGSFAGGLAGLLMAGPTGMCIGSRIGTVACVASVVGIILEGPIGVGILVVSVAGTILSAKNAQADEKRLLTLGDDRGKLMMVRSNIIIDPIWEDILAAARKSIPSTVKLPGLTTNAEKRRRIRDINIISSDESELTFSNKVFLLVSSSLNDKKSHPGHVYRYLMREYRKRALKHAHERAHVPLLNQKSCVEIQRATRDDTHAIMKYVTMVLFEARPGLASSSRLEEMTSSSVESLVFGEVYDLVLQEILDETRDIDNSLMIKISDFQVSAKTDFHDYVSDRALYALRGLPDAHSIGEKLNYIVQFLEEISYLFSIDQKSHCAICADNLLEMVCQHLIVAKVPNLNAEICFLQEFSHDDQLLRGKEGYALVTLQASLHFMNVCPNFDTLFEGVAHVT